MEKQTDFVAAGGPSDTDQVSPTEFPGRQSSVPIVPRAPRSLLALGGVWRWPIVVELLGRWFCQSWREAVFVLLFFTP